MAPFSGEMSAVCDGQAKRAASNSWLLNWEEESQNINTYKSKEWIL